MSEAKHTPGPWYWSDNYPTLDGRSNWSLIGADGYGVLCCDGVENSPQGLNDNKNADLIAAAPELLEALKHAVGWADGDDAIRRLDVDLMRAAITKATGAAE
jgi:hypothetical protein